MADSVRGASQTIMVGRRSLYTLLCIFPPALGGGRDFVVTTFGAVGDGTATHPGTNNTAAVRKAAAALAAAGGGALVFPPGNFSTGAFNLSSNMVLRLEPGAVVSGIQPRSLGEAAFDYPVVPWDGTGGTDAYGGASDFQGELAPQYQSFIHGYQLSNVTIEGGGTIWGGGDFWWRMWAGHGNQAKGSSPLNMSRPHTVHLVDVKGLTIRDVSVRRSPSWTLHLTFCSDVLVDSIHIQTNDSKADGGNAAFEPANADGLDIDSCRDVVVRNSTFHTHDDGIALKSGKDWFGRHVGRPTENVLIENCVSSSPDGAIVFGSEMSGGLRNITVRNHRAINSGMGLWIKSMRNRGGIVEDILFDGIEMDGIRLQLANIDMFYSCGKQTQHPCNASATPTIRSVRFQNIVAKNVMLSQPKEESLFWLRGLPESSIHDIAIENVSVSGIPSETKVVLATDATFTIKNVVLDGKPWSAAAAVPQDPDCAFASGSNWTNCRRKLVAEMFGTDGTLPSRSAPDDIIYFDGEQMHGLPAPGDGNRWNSNSSNSSSVAWKNNLTKLVWKLRPLGGGDDALVIDSPGSCPVARWSFEAGQLKLEDLCVTAPLGSLPHTAVLLQGCSSDDQDSNAAAQQHWTRDADSRFHLGNASGALCLNGYMPYTPPNTKLQVYPCSATPTLNEKFTIASNGSLISAAGGCVRNLRTEPVQLNATVWHTLNTSAVAPGNYPPLEPGMPKQREPPQNFQKTLLLYHNGHETATCSPNYDGVVDYFNELGYDMMEFNMPLIGCNAHPGVPSSHAWFEQWEEQGVHTMQYFIEPVVLAINYAQTLGYEKFVLLGLSGGGWSTTLAAAVDPRIQLSFPTAGSVPFDLKVGPYEGADMGDYEQLAARPIYHICGYECMYVLAGLETERAQLQLLHEWDPCCFRAQGRHPKIRAYNERVQTTLVSAKGGFMATAVTVGDFHEVNFRDKVNIAFVVEAMRRDGQVQPEIFKSTPFNLLPQ